VYYRRYANAARADQRVIRRPGHAKTASRHALNRTWRRCAERRRLNFVKVISSMQTKRYTRRKEYRFNQSSA
jgi:hypothetical protein